MLFKVSSSAFARWRKKEGVKESASLIGVVSFAFHIDEETAETMGKLWKAQMCLASQEKKDFLIRGV